MNTILWDLDTIHSPKTHLDVKNWIDSQGFLKGNGKFNVGDQIEFLTGYNDDIRATATVKGTNGDDIYVYLDAYWFPIQDTPIRNIKKCERDN